jgi:hypothetical protein
MVNKHFFKILTSFIFMILIGIISLFILGRVEESQKKDEAHESIPGQLNDQAAQVN